jgi:hypothetical protein
MHGPVEPLTITPHGVDQVARNEDLAAETPELRGRRCREDPRGDAAKPRKRRSAAPRSVPSRNRKPRRDARRAGGQVVNP